MNLKGIFDDFKNLNLEYQHKTEKRLIDVQSTNQYVMECIQTYGEILPYVAMILKMN